MKSILIFAVTVLSSVTFANSSQSTQPHVCYKLVNSANVDYNVPRKVCLQEMNLDFVTQKVLVDTKVETDLFKNMRLVFSSRHNEDVIRFTVKKTILEDVPVVCSAGRILDLAIEGRANNLGEVSVNDLKVEVTKTESNDFCHNYGETTVYSYVHQ